MRIVFDTNRKIGGGMTIGADFDKSRSRISTRYVNIEPGAIGEDDFSPFSESTLKIGGKLLDRT